MNTAAAQPPETITARTTPCRSTWPPTLPTWSPVPKTNAGRRSC